MSESNSKSYEYVDIFNIPISKMDMNQTVQYLRDRVEKRLTTQVITANPIMLMAALEDDQYKLVMQQAELIVPDGAGLVWAAKRIKNPVRERVAGIDLMMKLVEMAEDRQWKVYFMGASDPVIREAVSNLMKQFPRMIIAGYRDGYFTDADDAQVLEDLRKANPDLLFVGRAANQQEPWLCKYKDQLSIPVMIGVGGSFDVLSGKLKRAPKLWQSLRLEWLYRLLQEPWRYKRMFAIPKFMWRILKKR
jgi:N-acetylglucosaminyldiphosphoundecaprenol N-acetyl-beta-D-mannosaminyltransferase